MSGRTDSHNSEQPFQLVQKRSSGQTRRGMTRERDRATHSKSTSDKDATSSSSSSSASSSTSRSKRQQHHSKLDKEPRTRHHGASQGTRSSSSSQRQDQTRGRGEGGDKHREGFGHAHHLRSAREQQTLWGSITADKKLSPSDKLTSPNRFERLSLSEDTPTTTTSNRFDVLDPENEDFSPEGILEKGPRGRSSKCSHSPPKKTSAKEEDEEEKVKDLDEFDEGGVTIGTEGESPGTTDNTTLTTEGEEIESSPSEEKVTETSRETANGEEGEESPGKSSTSRIRYCRDELLQLKKAPLSLQKPSGLGTDCLKVSKLTLALDDEEGVEESKSRHRTLIREHDTRHLQKVCLSPQRRSFGSGCSWKESSSSGAGTPSGPPPTPPPGTSNEFFSEDRESGPRPPRPGLRSQQSLGHASGPPYQGSAPPHTHHGPRVIDHIPLRDRERGDKRNWRDKERSSNPAGGRYQSAPHEEEPEWMAFGPMDRFDVIELKGLDEHERQREARKKPEEKPLQDEGEDTVFQTSDAVRGEGESKEEEGRLEKNERVPESPGGLGDGVQKGEWAVFPEGDVKRQEEGGPENEFMLDGFDFSTGVSICQELASDDTEDVVPLSAKNPTHALLKALKIQDGHHKDDRVLSLGIRPANALTLDEIHARENIQTGPRHRTDGDQSAFNKLVAQLQSRPAQNHRDPHPVRNPPTSAVSSSLAKLPTSFQSERKANFGSQLEMELELSASSEDEDLLSSTHIPFPSTHIPFPSSTTSSLLLSGSRDERLRSSRLEHPSLTTHHSYSYPHYLNRLSGYQTSTAPPPREHWMSEVYPEPQMEPLRQLDSVRSSHQLAASRQHQMLAAATGRPSGANHWAVEMERRRVQELQYLQRERNMAGHPSHGGAGHHHMAPNKYPPPKPSISLLPTAVMRHIHNSKPSQSQFSDMTKPPPSPSVMANRLDQELTNKASQTHSTISNLLDYSDTGNLGGALSMRDYPVPAYHQPHPHPHGYPSMGMSGYGGGASGGGRMMRMGPMTGGGQRHMSEPGPYPPSHYYSMPRGMPAQNPYLQ